jgi:hypothetical protein
MAPFNDYDGGYVRTSERGEKWISAVFGCMQKVLGKLTWYKDINQHLFIPVKILCLMDSNK